MHGKDFFCVLESLVNSSLDDKRADGDLFFLNDDGLQSVESSSVKDVPGL